MGEGARGPRGVGSGAGGRAPGSSPRRSGLGPGLLGTLLAALAGPAGADEAAPRATGLRPPTAQERHWEEEHLAHAYSVQPNALAQRRSRAAGRSRALPACVDNSLLPSFPPIRDQGSLGACVDFAVTYYTATHMAGMVRGWDVRSGTADAYAFSPKWTYNLSNGGEDQGSWITCAYQVLQDHGAATWAQFPYDTDYRSWCLDPGVWQAALSFRMSTAGEIDAVSTETGLRSLKQMLANGYVLNFGTAIGGWRYARLSDDPAAAEDDGLAGKDVCTRVEQSNALHAMTIVGYNDAAWVDLNKNGAVDAGEKGALRIANSWGTGWRDGGFTWIAYDALRSAPATGDAPAGTRVAAFLDDRAYWIEPRAQYAPRRVARFTLSHARRNQLRVGVGVSDAGSTRPARVWEPAAFRSAGGPYAFDGSTTPCDGTFVVDLTDMPVGEGWQRWYLVLADDTAGSPATLRSFRVASPPVAGAEWRAANVPQVVDAGEALSWADAGTDGTSPPPGAAPSSSGALAIASSWADDTGAVRVALAGSPNASDASDRGKVVFEAPAGVAVNLGAPGVVVDYAPDDRQIRVGGLALKAGDTYRVVLRGIRDSSGVSLVEDGVANVARGTVADATPPSLTGATADDGGKLQVTLSEALDPFTTVDASCFAVTGPDGSPLDLSGPGVVLSYSVPLRTATLTGLRLTAGSTLVVTASRLCDVAGNRIEEGKGRTRSVAVADVTPPAIAGSSVADTGIAVVRFSEPLQPAEAASEQSYLIESPTGTPVSLSPPEVTLRYDPSERAVTIAGIPVRAGDTYRIRVRSLRDTAGNAIVDAAPSAESAGVVSDTAAPVVIQREPAAGATGAPAASAIRIEFSKPMDAASVARALSLRRRSDGAAIDAVASGSGSVYRLTPTAALAPGEEYLVTLLGNATDVGGRSLDGDRDGQAEGSPADDLSWSFATQSLPGTPQALAPEEGAVVFPAPEFRLACPPGAATAAVVRVEAARGSETRVFDSGPISGRAEVAIAWDGQAPAEGEWSWRARLIDAAGLESAWSAPRALQVAARPAAVPRGLTTFGLAISGGECTLSDLGIDAAQIAAWDTTRQQYTLLDSGTRLVPGKGYWLQATRPAVPRFSGRTPAGPCALPLSPGWNLVSPPVLRPVAWSLDDLTVHCGSEVKTLRDARASGWMSDYAIGWEQEGTDAGVGRYRITYDATRAPGVAGHLLPWHAYWVYAFRECTLTLPDAAQASRSTRQPGRAAGRTGAWAVRLQARRGGQAGEVVVGVSADGGAAPAAPAPPTQAAPLRIRSMAGAAALAMDLRRAGSGRQVWDISVDPGGAAPGESITLTWPDLRAIPADVALFLEDPAAGTRRDLRTSGAYSFAAGDTERLLRLVAQPRAGGRALISALELAPLRGGSYSVRFALSSSASVDVELVSPNGGTVATLARGRASTAALNTVPCRAEVPPGIYLLRVTATADEGSRTQAVRLVVLSR